MQSRVTFLIWQLSITAYRHVNKVLFWTFRADFKMMTSPIPKVCLFCQPPIIESPVLFFFNELHEKVTDMYTY